MLPTPKMALCQKNNPQLEESWGLGQLLAGHLRALGHRPTAKNVSEQ
jgi:hypothetical protein